MLSDIKEIPTVTIGSYTLRLEVEEPSPELLEKGRKELRETPDLASQSITTLQDLIRGNVVSCNAFTLTIKNQHHIKIKPLETKLLWLSVE